MSDNFHRMGSQYLVKTRSLKAAINWALKRQFPAVCANICCEKLKMDA